MRGIDKFKERFAGHDGEYVLIGGGACDLLFGEAGQDFRATKDCLCQAGNEQSGTRNLSSLADGLVKRSPSRASAPHPCGGSIPRTR